MRDGWVAPSLAFLGGAAVCWGLLRVSLVADSSSMLARVRALALHERLRFLFSDAHGWEPMALHKYSTNLGNAR